MRIIYHKLFNENIHPILVHATNVLNEWGFNIFRKKYELMSHYHVIWYSHGVKIVTKGETGKDKRVFNVYQRKCG